MLFPTVDDSQALGRNMAYANQAKQQRFRDVLTRMAQDAQPTQTPGGPMSMIGGPTPDPAWDAFFGSLQDAQDRAGASVSKIRMKPASITGLQQAAGISPLDSQYVDNPLSPLNRQYRG